MTRIKDLAANLQTEEQIEYGYQQLIQMNRAELAKMANTAIQAVKDGEYDDHKAYAFGAKMLNVGKSLTDGLRPIIESRLQQSITSYNVELKPKETSVDWDFSLCGDTEWQYLKERAAFYAQELKDREALLKTITKPTVIEVQGELIEVKPPIRKSKAGFAATIK